MKLATLKDGTRDGQLAIVSRDLKTAQFADGIAPTLQRALDDWAFIAPQLDDAYRQLNEGKGRYTFDFDPANCMAPLPRAHERVTASAYLSQVEQARNPAAARPDEPLLRQSGGNLLGARDDILVQREEWGIDFGAGLAAITGDIPLGASVDDAYQQIRLLALANDIVLRKLMPDELAQGYGPLLSHPATGYSPVVVTPDELGDAWKGGKVHLPLRVTWNGKPSGQPNAGAGMLFNFPQLIAHVVRTRSLGAGAIIGTGPVANQEGKGGYASIAEKRCREVAAEGAASTPFMAFEDTIRIEMLDGDGKSVFGAVEQLVKRLETGTQF